MVMGSPLVRVFVGCAPDHDDLESQSVFEWSLRKHSSMPVDVVWMQLSSNPESPFYSDLDISAGWNTKVWATPFSGFRWAVPALCNFEGQGIYFDSDFIIFGDIAELWETEFEPNKIIQSRSGRDWRLCCSKWDCAAAKTEIPPFARLQKDSQSHRALTSKFGPGCHHIQPFPENQKWNNLDGRDGISLADPSLKALHYTCMGTQPQLPYALKRLASAGRRHWYDGKVSQHPRKDVRDGFAELLKEAIENGYGPERYAELPIFGKRYAKRSFAGR